MRWPLSALFFVIASFVFFVFWAASSYLISQVHDAMVPFAAELGSSEYNGLLAVLPTAFGIISIIFFVVGILVLYVVDSLSEEPEMYYRY